MSDVAARAAGMAAFDSLPPALRAELTRAAYPPDCQRVASILRSLLYQGLPHDIAVAALIAELPAAEEIALAQFAKEYRQRHRTPLPHVAAQVPLLRG